MIFFEDLMGQPDFYAALESLIPEYRDKFSLPEIYQLGLVVKDVEAAALYLEERGVNKLGPMDTQFVYMDTEKTIGIIIEFISRKFFGLDWWPLDPVFKVAARFQKWTGKRIRAMDVCFF